VFGGRGFVGSAVCQEALKTGLNVVSISPSGEGSRSSVWHHTQALQPTGREAVHTSVLTAHPEGVNVACLQPAPCFSCPAAGRHAAAQQLGMQCTNGGICAICTDCAAAGRAFHAPGFLVQLTSQLHAHHLHSCCHAVAQSAMVMMCVHEHAVVRMCVRALAASIGPTTDRANPPPGQPAHCT
jgi:hypothetical protein